MKLHERDNNFAVLPNGSVWFALDFILTPDECDRWAARLVNMAKMVRQAAAPAEKAKGTRRRKP